MEKIKKACAQHAANRNKAYGNVASKGFTIAAFSGQPLCVICILMNYVLVK